MNKRGFSNILVVILFLSTIAGVAGYFIFLKKQTTTPTTISTPTNNITQKTISIDNSYSDSELPSLTADKKDIIFDNRVLLSIDHNAIFDWFKTKSQLCDGYNLTSATDRKEFCENKASFRQKSS